jgi:tetratricopeptide (TPR) repeat protein
MKRLVWILLTTACGCVSTETRLLSQKEIVSQNEETRKSVIDVKIQKYERLAREFPKEAKHRERLAAFYWELEDYQNALKNLKIARELDPGNAKYDYIEGRIHRENGSFDLALASFKRVLERTPDDKHSGPHYDLAWIYLETRRIPEAIEELRICLEIEPASPLPHYMLGKIYLEQLNDKATAVRHLETYMEMKGSLYHEEVRRLLIGLQPEFGRVRYQPTQ